MKRTTIVSAILLTGVAVPIAANAQTAPPPQTSLPEELTVEGRRMPSAEAPRSATCEALARDPSFRAQIAAAEGNPYMGPRVFLPVRMPRNPDYNAPPKVAAGSPIPQPGRGRFGGDPNARSGTTAADVAILRDDNSSSDPSPFDMGGNDGYNRDDAVQACRLAFSAGAASVSSSGAAPASGAAISPLSFDTDARAAAARASIAARDTSLPTALALFDQGRYAESLPFFRTAATKLPDRDGGDEATLFLGKLYMFGLGDKSDPAEGLKYLKKTATARFDPALEMPVFDPARPQANTAVGEAAMILAELYRTGGKGVAKDEAEARRWYERALAVGHVDAARILGDLYYAGTSDTPRDVAKALTYYRRAAKLDHSGAQVALGDILSAGEDGVAKNRSEALGWYNAAAKHDYAPAIYELARAYHLGDGVPVDREKAIGLYKTAALAGSAAAQAALGAFFYEGKIVAKDDTVARQWFEQAAKGGDGDGMVNLAAMLGRGEGGARDRVRAWALLTLAARQRHPSAAAMRVALEKQMTPEERQAASGAP